MTWVVILKANDTLKICLFVCKRGWGRDGEEGGQRVGGQRE